MLWFQEFALHLPSYALDDRVISQQSYRIKQSCFQSKVSTFVRRCLTAGSSLLAVFPRWCCSYRLLLVNSLRQSECTLTTPGLLFRYWLSSTYLHKFEKWSKVSRPFPVSSVSGSVLLQSRHITHSDSWRHGFSADILQIYKIYQLQLHSHPWVNCTGFLLKAVQSQFNSRRGQGTWGIQQN